MSAFVDHGTDDASESLAITLHASSTVSSNAADHIEVLRAALVQLPCHQCEQPAPG